MDKKKKPDSKLGGYFKENEAEKPQAASQKSVPKTRSAMREAIIWSEIIMPPLAKRKKAKPYTLPR
jgi:hypothetical protein